MTRLSLEWLERNYSGDLGAVLAAHDKARAEKPKRKPTRQPGVMNGTESRYAESLEARRLIGAIASWSFETDRFILADDTSYLPDFRVEITDGSVQFHEVKGSHVWEKNRIKLKVCAAMYTDYRFLLAQWKPARVVRGRPVAAGWSVRRVPC